jgi:hypothetical protein
MILSISLALSIFLPCIALAAGCACDYVIGFFLIKVAYWAFFGTAAFID